MPKDNGYSDAHGTGGLRFFNSSTQAALNAKGEVYNVIRIRVAGTLTATNLYGADQFAATPVFANEIFHGKFTSIVPADSCELVAYKKKRRNL